MASQMEEEMLTMLCYHMEFRCPALVVDHTETNTKSQT